MSQLDLMNLQQTTMSCRRCQLHTTRTKAVIGRGSNVYQNRPVLFVGEAPGAEEDKVGLPFVGASGKLLDRWIIELGLTSYYITNTVRCRPPGNRRPELHELTWCRCYLEREIEILKPICIVTLGRVAQNAVAKLKLDIPTFFIYHPSYFIRNGSRSELWKPPIEKLQEQICKVMFNDEPK